MGLLGKISKGIGNVVGDVVGGITGASAQADAAKKAGNQQAAYLQQGIAQFQPYAQAGTNALTAYGNLAGINGTAAQGSAINALQAGPQFQALLQQGNNSILQNASATGGLRGGNVQSALAQFSPALLSNLIQQQLSTYGGLATTGQDAAGSIANLLSGQGSALSGATIAAGNRNAIAAQQAGSIAGSLFGGGIDFGNLGKYLGVGF